MNQITINDPNQKGRLSFTLRMGSNRPWWRDLDLDGQPLYRIGNICNTCESMFSKYEIDKLPLTPSGLAEKLHSGLTSISNEVIDTIKAILPNGNYIVSILKFRPALVEFRKSVYYLWENPQPLKIPAEWLNNSERIKPWWFAQPKKSPGFQEGKLYEAVFPLISKKSLQKKEIKKYISELKNNDLIPTALALSVVDVRFVSGRAFDWRLIHFLLDGHHKMMAASQSNKPIKLLSFLNTSESFSPDEWVERTVKIRYGGHDFQSTQPSN